MDVSTVSISEQPVHPEPPEPGASPAVAPAQSSESHSARPRLAESVEATDEREWSPRSGRGIWPIAAGALFLVAIYVLSPPFVFAIADRYAMPVGTAVEIIYWPLQLLAMGCPPVETAYDVYFAWVDRLLSTTSSPAVLPYVTPIGTP